jgi:hypothetical protein
LDGLEYLGDYRSDRAKYGATTVAKVALKVELIAKESGFYERYVEDDGPGFDFEEGGSGHRDSDWRERRRSSSMESSTLYENLAHAALDDSNVSMTHRQSMAVDVARDRHV